MQILKKSTLFFLFFPLLNSLAQDPGMSEYSGEDFPDRVRGELYFKVAPKSGVDVPAFRKEAHSSERLAELPELQKLLAPYEVTRIHCPFRHPDPGIQHTFKMEFDVNDEAETDELIEKLEALSYTDYAEPVQRYRSFYQPDDIAPEQEWFLDSIKAEAAWAMNVGDREVKVAIVDDAVNVSHPDLEGAISENLDETLDGTDTDGNGYVDDVNGWDAADDDNSPEPPASHSIYGISPVYGHGTHTAGIAAGMTDNGKGIASVGFNSSIIPIKTVSDDSPLPFGLEAPAEGVDYAISAGADIISMSFGGDKSAFNTLDNLLDQAHQDSIVLIAAAGNDGASDTLWPAGKEEVIAVGSTTHGDTMSTFSQYGTWLDLVAPGDSIYSTYWEGGGAESTYENQAGTSMACPLVAGAASLMKSYGSSATPSQIRHCLKAGAKKIDSINPSYIDSMGAGRLNVHASLECLDSMGVETDSSTVSLSEEAARSSEALLLYPNPSTDGNFRWHSEGERKVKSVRVLDMTGRTMQHERFAHPRRKGRMQLGELSENIYLVRFRTERGELLTRKLSLVR